MTRALTTAPCVSDTTTSVDSPVFTLSRKARSRRSADRAAKDLVLGRLLKAVVGEPDRLREQPGGRKDLPPGEVLRGGGRVERMLVAGHRLPLLFI